MKSQKAATTAASIIQNVTNTESFKICPCVFLRFITQNVLPEKERKSNSDNH